jgi:DNA-binding PadR family transcriptional regulator
MVGQGDLRLIVLALIAQQPRHGYKIIKIVEEKTGGWYSPSPGIVYPALTYLREARYVTVQAEGPKKLYTITLEGRAHLDASRDLIEAVLERLAAIGESVARVRQCLNGDDDRTSDLPPIVRAAINNLREVAAKRLEHDAESEAKLVEVLARAASELKNG